MPGTVREIQKPGLPHLLSTVLLLYTLTAQSARGCLLSRCWVVERANRFQDFHGQDVRSPRTSPLLPKPEKRGTPKLVRGRGRRATQLRAQRGLNRARDRV